LSCASAACTLPFAASNVDSVLSGGVLRDEVLLEQLLVHRGGLLRHRVLRLGRLQLALPLEHARVEVRGIHAHQQLPRLHGLPFAHGDLAYITRNLGLDGGLMDGLHRPGDRQPTGQRPRLDGRKLVRREMQRHGGVLPGAAAVGLLGRTPRHRAADTRHHQ
jgi:hypothetical protein